MTGRARRSGSRSPTGAISIADRLRVLVVEDNDYDAHRIDEALGGSETTEFTVERSHRLDDALQKLEADPFDATLLDLGLPDSTGLDTLRQVRQAHPDVPVVVLTGLRDEEVALEAIRDGAHDYLVKDHVDAFQLGHTVRHAVERKQLAGRAENALRRLVGRTEDPARRSLVLGLVREMRSSTTFIVNSLVQIRQELEGSRGDVDPDRAPRMADAVESTMEGINRQDQLLKVLLRFFGDGSATAKRASLHEPTVAAIYLFQAMDRSGVGVDADLEPTGPVDAEVYEVQSLVLALLRGLAGAVGPGELLSVATTQRDGRAVLRVEGPAADPPDLEAVSDRVQALGGTLSVDGVDSLVAAVELPHV